jgi:hypothetical protein
MKCLTICEPYASAFVVGPKDVENRSWPTAHRGWLLIHASRSKVWQGSWYIDGCHRLWPAGAERTFHYGCLIGIVRIQDCVRPEASNPWASGPWCWRRDSSRLEFANPVPWRGRQRLFNVPDRVVAEAITRGAIPHGTTPKDFRDLGVLSGNLLGRLNWFGSPMTTEAVPA